MPERGSFLSVRPPGGWVGDEPTDSISTIGRGRGAGVRQSPFGKGLLSAAKFSPEKGGNDPKSVGFAPIFVNFLWISAEVLLVTSSFSPQRRAMSVLGTHSITPFYARRRKVLTQWM